MSTNNESVTIMTKGKAICKALKSVRKRIAEANEIDYQPRECHHEGECAGTCPACEAEVRYLELQISMRRRAGKAVVIAGLSLSLGTLAGCNLIQPTAGAVERDPSTVNVSENDSIEQLAGEVEALPDSLLDVEQKK